LVKHARYYWLLLAESYLTRRLFESMLRLMETFATASRIGAAARRNQSDDGGGVEGGVSEKSLRNQASHGFLAWAENPRGTKRLAVGTNAKKVASRTLRGVFFCRRTSKMEIPIKGIT